MCNYPYLRLLLGALFFSLSTLGFSQYNFKLLDHANTKDYYGDSSVLVIDYPVLTGQTRADGKGPFYRHLVLFGNGEFAVSEAPVTDSVTHAYGAGTGMVYARAYSDGVYTEEDDDPPNNIMGPTAPFEGPVPTQRDSIVEEGRYLHVFRSVDVRPGDSMMMVVSVRNADTSYLNGQVVFLYNGRMEEKSAKGTPTPNGEFGQSTLHDALIYERSNSNGANLFYSKLPDGLDDYYQRAWVAPFSELGPGDEIRFFLDLANAKEMFGLIQDTLITQLDFTAVLMVSSEISPERTPPSVAESPQGQAIAQHIGFIYNAAIDSLRRFSILGDSTALVSPTPTAFQYSGFKVVDIYPTTASLVKSHDPNFLRLQACACEEKQAVYQILATVQCENDGFKETDHIYIDMKLPAGITADNIVTDPISYYPHNPNGANIQFQPLGSDSIRWFLKGFALQSTRELGVGHPYTYAQIQFLMYSTVKPSDLPPMEACIRFDDPGNEPVCTPASTVIGLTSIEPGTEILACEACDDPVPALDGETPPPILPWWAWLLLFLLVIALLLLLLRRRQSGS